MSAIDRRLDKLEETLAPELQARFAFANSKAHAEQLVADDKAERAKDPNVTRGPLTIFRWLESKEEAARVNFHDPAATENVSGNIPRMEPGPSVGY